ncbi:hypothetical protein HAZT_HAZT012076 [Hyalella azteca]|uniref:Uncharacterized protein n=1 Tax=Hyalella azteca TaxID=294128 RepID=A0A6A0GWN6_HYAAZ|nr:hypothetical protein HAZT_HAZT012076 [Hyalella azteca]
MALTVCDMTFLTALLINENQLMRLPPAIGNLVNLKQLDASHNCLVVLPPQIGDLTNLE